MLPLARYVPGSLLSHAGAGGLWRREFYQFRCSNCYNTCINSNDSGEHTY